MTDVSANTRIFLELTRYKSGIEDAKRDMDQLDMQDDVITMYEFKTFMNRNFNGQFTTSELDTFFRQMDTNVSAGKADHSTCANRNALDGHEMENLVKAGEKVQQITAALQRFIASFGQLPEGVQNRLGNIEEDILNQIIGGMNTADIANLDVNNIDFESMRYNISRMILEYGVDYQIQRLFNTNRTYNDIMRIGEYAYADDANLQNKIDELITNAMSGDLTNNLVNVVNDLINSIDQYLQAQISAFQTDSTTILTDFQKANIRMVVITKNKAVDQQPLSIDGENVSLTNYSELYNNYLKQYARRYAENYDNLDYNTLINQAEGSFKRSSEYQQMVTEIERQVRMDRARNELNDLTDHINGSASNSTENTTGSTSYVTVTGGFIPRVTPENIFNGSSATSMQMYATHNASAGITNDSNADEDIQGVEGNGNNGTVAPIDGNDDEPLVGATNNLSYRDLDGLVKTQLEILLGYSSDKANELIRTAMSAANYDKYQRILDDVFANFDKYYSINGSVDYEAMARDVAKGIKEVFYVPETTVDPIDPENPEEPDDFNNDYINCNGSATFNGTRTLSTTPWSYKNNSGNDFDWYWSATGSFAQNIEIVSSSNGGIKIKDNAAIPDGTYSITLVAKRCACGSTDAIETVEIPMVLNISGLSQPKRSKEYMIDLYGDDMNVNFNYNYDNSTLDKGIPDGSNTSINMSISELYRYQDSRSTVIVGAYNNPTDFSNGCYTAIESAINQICDALKQNGTNEWKQQVEIARQETLNKYHEYIQVLVASLNGVSNGEKWLGNPSSSSELEQLDNNNGAMAYCSTEGVLGDEDDAREDAKNNAHLTTLGIAVSCKNVLRGWQPNYTVELNFSRVLQNILANMN